MSETERADWKDNWYPVAFRRDLVATEPHAFAIFGERYVLFADGRDGFACLVDRCAHRSARLSSGRVCGGRIECLYHGWQYAVDGRCVHIPQRDADEGIPARARVGTAVAVERQGIVWVWPGAAERANATAIPRLDELERGDCATIDFLIELPYDQGALIENVIDIAHIHVAHDGARGGGHRDLAAPLSLEVGELGPGGFRGTFRSLGVDRSAIELALSGAEVEFRAPNLVAYAARHRDRGLVSGLALYSLPVDRDRCRLLYRAWSNHWPWWDRLKPRWLEHWSQCHLLEQDLQVVVGQQTEIETSGKHLRDLWLPLRSSDLFVVKHRQWIDLFAADRPFQRGWSTNALRDEEPPSRPVLDRMVLHTRHCASCRVAHHVAARAGRWSFRLAVVCVALAVLAASAVGAPAVGTVLAGMAVALVLGATFANGIERRFQQAVVAERPQ